MIVGLGIDIVDVESFRSDFSDCQEALNETFSEEEISYCFAKADPYQSLAARFAAKEAVMKALGTGSTDEVDFSDVIIAIGEEGPPYVILRGGAAEVHIRLGSPKMHLSITHLRSIASAVVVLDQ
jgi:holo-[acyl-carrier protein] synthase